MDESQATAGPTPEADPLGLPGKTSGAGPSLCRWAWHWLCRAPPEDLQGPGLGELRKKLSTHSSSTRCHLIPQRPHPGPSATCLTHTPASSPRLPVQRSWLSRTAHRHCQASRTLPRCSLHQKRPPEPKGYPRASPLPTRAPMPRGSDRPLPAATAPSSGHCTECLDCQNAHHPAALRPRLGDLPVPLHAPRSPSHHQLCSYWARVTHLSPLPCCAP